MPAGVVIIVHVVVIQQQLVLHLPHAWPAASSLVRVKVTTDVSILELSHGE